MTMNEIIKDINDNLKQKNASQKDELRVMQAMLNDREYVVDVYGKEGKIGEVCPALEHRKMLTSTLISAAKISKEEAMNIANSHEVSKSEAANMVAISKEFVNTYTQTNRKLPLGGRATSNVVLMRKDIEEKTRQCPVRVGVADDETPIYEKVETKIPAHSGIKVQGSCPAWLKK